MIIGAGRSGKSSLGRWLDQQDWFPGAARGENPDSWNRRTPTLVYRGAVIEAPGAYLESPWMRQHLIAAAQDACCVLMLADSKERFIRRDLPGYFPVRSWALSQNAT